MTPLLETKTRAARLLAAGVTPKLVARECGITMSTLTKWGGQRSWCRIFYAEQAAHVSVYAATIDTIARTRGMRNPEGAFDDEDDQLEAMYSEDDDIAEALGFIPA